MKRYTWLLVFLLVAVPGWAWGATYYFSTSGNDSTGDGSYATPWKTIQKANTTLASASADDKIAFKVGETWTWGSTYWGSATYLNIASSGTSGHPIVICAYEGNGDFTLEGGETKPVIDGGTLTTYPARDSSGLVRSTDHDYITIQDIKIYQSPHMAIKTVNCNNVTVSRCDIEYTGEQGLHINYGDDCILEDCNVSRTCRQGEGNGSSVIFQNSPRMIVRRNTVHSSANYPLYYTRGREGINVYKCIDALVENNTVYGMESVGIYGGSSHTALIRNNLIYWTNDTEWWESSTKPGIGIGYCDESADAGNTGENIAWIGNVVIGAGWNFEQYQSSTGSYMDNCHMLNNTFIEAQGTDGLQMGIRLPAVSDRFIINNSVIKNNIILQTAGIIAQVPASSELTMSHNFWSRIPEIDARGTGDPVYGDPKFNTTITDWNAIEVGEVTMSDVTPKIDSNAVNTGDWHMTFTRSGTTLTVACAHCVWPGDTIYEDDGTDAVVVSRAVDPVSPYIGNGTIVIDDATDWDTSGGISVRAFSGTKPDIGAVEFNETPDNPVPEITAESCTAATTTITYSMTVSNLPASEALTYSWKINGLEFSTTANGTYNASAYNNQNVTVVGYVYDSGSQSDATQSYNFYLGTPTSATYTFGENGTTTSTHFTGVTNDTNINGGATTTNYNSDTYLITNNYSGTTYDKKFLLSFDFSDLSVAQAAATISSAKLYLYYKDAGTDQTVALYTCSNAFVDSQATWNIYSTGNNWTGTHGQDDTLGTFLVTSSDGAGHAYETALSSTTDLQTAWTAKGKFYVVGTLSDEGSAQFQGAAGTANYRPTLSVTVGEVPPTGDCKPSRVYSVPATATYKDDDVVPIYVEFTQDCGYLTVTGTPTVKLETGATDETAPYVSGTGNTTLRFDYTVSGEHSNTSLDLACHADFLVLGAATIKDSGNANPDSLALPTEANRLEALCDVVIDTEPPATITTTEICDANGNAVEADVTITSDASIAYFALNFPEGAWFVDGSLSALPIVCTGPTYGTVTLYYAGTQPTGWGVGTSDWLYAYDVEDGARGTATLPAAIVPVDGAKIIDHAGNELASYNLNNSYKWVIADPRDWLLTDDFATLTAWKAGVVNEVPDDSVTFSDITEPDAVDLSGFDGTDGYPITYTGTSLTVPSTGLTVGDWAVVDIREIIGNLTTGTNAVVSDLVIDGNLTASGTITRVMIK